MSKPGLPSIPSQSSPKNRLKPIKTNITVPIQKSIRFFIKMFPVFFALVKPASHIAKPACIQNTKAAPIKNQTLKTSLEIALKISSIYVLQKIKKTKAPNHFRFSAFALDFDYHNLTFYVNISFIILCFTMF